MGMGICVAYQTVKNSRWRDISRILALCSGFGVVACAQTPSTPVTHQPPLEPEILYVSPKADASGDGSRARPVPSISEALLKRSVKTIRLLPGEYAGPTILVTHPIKIEGVPTATVAAHVFVGADNVVLKNLLLSGGLRIALAEKVKLTNLRISSGEADQALAVHRSQISMEHVTAFGGFNAVVEVTSSTVVARSVSLISKNSERSLRVDDGLWTAVDSFFRGGRVASIQATGSSTVVFDRAEIGPGPGHGLFLWSPTVVGELRDTHVKGRGGSGVLAQGGRLKIYTSTISDSKKVALAIQGANTSIRNTTLRGGVSGVLNISSFRGQQPRVVLSDSDIYYTPFETGVFLGSGFLSLEDVQIIGLKKLGSQPALLAQGPRTALSIKNVVVEDARGSALELRDDVDVYLEGLKVIAASGDGILIENLRAGMISIRETSVRACQSGAGLRVLNSAFVKIDGLDVYDCPDGGVIFGDRARGFIRSAQVKGGRFGIAAFGGAWLSVSNATIAGDVWSVFGECLGDTRLRDDGETEFLGPSKLCP